MKKRNRPTAILTIMAIIIIIIIAIAAVIINGLTHDYCDDRAWESLDRNPHIETDTIEPGNMIDSTGIRGMVLIGEETAMAVKRLSARFDIDSIVTGDSPTDVNYTLSRNGSVEIVLQNSHLGRIGAIFILGSGYFTDCGIGVGSTFASVFSAYPEAEMRLGEAEDGINGSSELCKAAPGILFLKWLDEDATPRIARYNDEGIAVSFIHDYTLLRIDEIIITPHIWQ